MFLNAMHTLFFSSPVQLWTSSNYQWFLKQTLAFDSVHGNVSALTWDPEQAGRLHVVTSEGHYLQYTWTWVTNRSLGQTSCDPTNVFVINGSEHLNHQDIPHRNV